ncbi:MAG: MBOAT family protein [Prevotella sp.]|nr:MBOAT family protein [Prevotella sp.]MCR5152379.1 MBOAT family protein [Prevotella sp.]
MELLDKILDVLKYNPAEPMIFSSGTFLMLFLGFAFVYMMLEKKFNARILFVTLFSYYFYYKSSGLYFFLLAVVTVSDFYIAKLISENRDNKTYSKRLMILSLLIDLGLLGYFKYTNFLAGAICQMFGHNFQPWDIFLPVGISFFTFQSMSYTIDVYRGQLKPLNKLMDYAFYVSFFPQLVAGPIVRARDFIPQIRKPIVVTKTMFAEGVYLILIGLFKKAVISDYISLNFIDRIFENPSLYSGVEILLGLYGYTIQLYCDFSGYSDMAIGIALLLGFHFPQNFNAPLKSVSVADFWRRWHISLSSWIRDYIYFSLGGSRKGKFMTYVNLFIAMVLCGIWHGANFNYVFFGILQGIAMVVHRYYRLEILHHDKHYESKGWKRIGGILVTMHFFCLSWILFRNTSFDDTFTMLNQLFTSFHPELLFDVLAGYKYVFMLVAFGFVTHYLPSSVHNKCVEVMKRGGVLFNAILLVIVIFIVIQVKSSGIQPFIYFQF